MTVTIKLKPEIEAGLLAQAKASGKTLEEFLQSLVEAFVFSGKQTMTSEERASAFEAWSAGHRVTRPLSDDDVSRESMYKGRDAG